MTETTPSTTPAKKNPWRIIGPIIGVVVVLAGIFWTVVMPALEDAKYKADACVNVYPTSEVTTSLTEKPKVVDCSDSAAVAKIVAVFDEKTLDDAESACPSWGTETTAAIELTAESFLSKDKLLCLTEA